LAAVNASSEAMVSSSIPLLDADVVRAEVVAVVVGLVKVETKS
jgi:hypothetical protein